MCKKFKNFVKRQLYWEASLYLSSRFYSRWFVSLFSVFIWTKWWLKNYCIDFFHTFFVYIFGRASAWDHSHKKQEDSLETRAALIEVFILCWNLPSSPKHRGWLQKKNIAFPEGNKLFAGTFPANLDKTNADMVQFTKRYNWKWIV